MLHLDESFAAIAYAFMCAVISGILIGILVSLIGIKDELRDISNEFRKRKGE